MNLFFTSDPFQERHVLRMDRIIIVRLKIRSASITSLGKSLNAAFLTELFRSKKTKFLVNKIFTKFFVLLETSGIHMKDEALKEVLVTQNCLLRENTEQEHVCVKSCIIARAVMQTKRRTVSLFKWNLHRYN